MSEEQNDSPAFRLRPRRSAPKSYYAVRLEYSANPEAFIRERPRAKRKAFTQKSGSNSTHLPNQVATANSHKPNVITKEERERDEKRMLLHRGISESLAINTSISPFMQRLELDELEPDSLYEHNYINLRIRHVEQSHIRRLLSCSCISLNETDSQYAVTVKLHNDYADSDIVRVGMILSVAKFRTSPKISVHDDSLIMDPNRSAQQTPSQHANSLIASNQTTSSSADRTSLSSPSRAPGHPNSQSQKNLSTTSVKAESLIDSKSIGKSPSEITHDSRECSSAKYRAVDTSNDSTDNTTHTIHLPFYIVVKYDELVERSTSNSNRGASNTFPQNTSPTGSASVSRRPVVPFVSVSDMIEQPIEPYVEMCPPSPRSLSEVDKIDEENQESKKVKFTASV